MKIIKGSLHPKAEEKTFYELSNLLTDFGGGIFTSMPEEKFVWTLYKSVDKKWKKIEGNVKEGQKAPYTFGEKVVGIPYKIEVHSVKKHFLTQNIETKLAANLVVTPRTAKEPIIGRVILLNRENKDVNKAKFNERLIAQARTSYLLGKEITFYLWEEGASELQKYQKPKKAYVNKHGIAEVKFNLSEYASPNTFMDFFGGTNATKKFYVTAVYEEKKLNNKTPVTATNEQPQPQKPAPQTPQAPQTPAKKEENGLLNGVEIIAEGIGKYIAEIMETKVSAAVVKGEKEEKKDGTCGCNNDVTEEQLKTIFPNATPDNLKLVAETYTKYMKDLGMNTCWNKAHFFAQARVESGLALSLKEGEGFNYYWESIIGTFKAFQSKEGREKAKLWGRAIQNRNDPKAVDVPTETQIKIANYAYSPPAAKAKELGNTEPNDGWNYRGRGLIQVTGKAFYQYCNPYTLKYNKVDVIKNPDSIGEKLELCVSSGMIFFKWKNINKLANTTRDVKGKICPLVGKDVIKGGVSKNHQPKQDAFDNITSKVFKLNECKLKGSAESNNTRQPKKKGKYDIDSAVTYIVNNAEPKSLGKCAKYVRLAINAGGITNIFGHATEYYDTDKLVKYGFTKLGTDLDSIQLKKGDIAAFGSVKGHPYGHIAMWTGTQWVSDFKQKSFWVANQYSVEKKYAIYRWEN